MIRAAVGADLLDKLRAVIRQVAPFDTAEAIPFDTTIDDVLGPCEAVVAGRRVLMFGSNNYLGLTCHPQVLAASEAALAHYGTGTTGSRVANGTLALHRGLERDLARVFDKRRALIFTTGYQANLAVIGALAGADDVILLDAESHASIWDGARLSGATVLPFRHNAPDSLERKLARLPRGARNSLVVIEGLYSIRADTSPIAAVVDVCRRHGAYLLVDEAHAFGAFGPRGLGWSDAQGVLPDVDFLVGTFSKALGGVGGFCVSDHDELRGVGLLGRSYIFTVSGAPATVAGVRAALGILAGDHSHRDRLWANIQRLRTGLQSLGFSIGATAAPIVPIFTGAGIRTAELWQQLIVAGVYVNLVVPPACPMDACLLRASCSAAHTTEHVDQALERFEAVGARLGFVGSSAGFG